MQAKITTWAVKFQDLERELIVSQSQKGIPLPPPSAELGIHPKQHSVGAIPYTGFWQEAPRESLKPCGAKAQNKAAHAEGLHPAP